MVSITFKIEWSNQFTELFIKDFIYVENAVLFGGTHSREYFENKYIKNIYGPSALIVAYCGDKPVGAHAMWRNDINGVVAYQDSDSCVLPEFQGLLIFTDMTYLLKKEIGGKDVFSYGFPNSQSGPIGKICRSKVIARYKPRLFLSCKGFSNEHLGMIPYDYAKWWISFKESNAHSIHIGNHYYIVKKKKRKGFLYIIGETDRNTALLFPMTSPCFRILTYSSLKEAFYSKKSTAIEVLSPDTKEQSLVPSWKVDAI